MKELLITANCEGIECEADGVKCQYYSEDFGFGETAVCTLFPDLAVKAEDYFYAFTQLSLSANSRALRCPACIHASSLYADQLRNKCKEPISSDDKNEVKECQENPSSVNIQAAQINDSALASKCKALRSELDKINHPTMTQAALSSYHHAMAMNHHQASLSACGTRDSIHKIAYSLHRIASSLYHDGKMEDADFYSDLANKVTDKIETSI